MKARKTMFFLAGIIVLGLMVFSSLSAVYAFAAGNPLSKVKTKSGEAPVVRSHRITASELKAMERKLGVSEEGQDYNDVVDGHGTGLRAPTASEWQQLSETAQIVDSVSLVSTPASVDNSILPWFPPVGNQGSEGACVGFSAAYYAKTFQEAKEHGWNLTGATWGGSYPGYPTPTYQSMIMSPEFVYHLINGGTNNGGSFQDAINIICSIGVSSWQKMPYSAVDHTTWPSTAAWAEAPYYRGNASGYQHLSIETATGIQSLKNLVASGTLASIGIDGDEFSAMTTGDLWTLDNYSPASSSSINHGNTIVGYDDNMSYSESGLTRQGAFKVVNSWGVGGNWEHVPDGFYWISYEAMRLRVGLYSDAMFYYDLNNYQPDLVASFAISHAYRGECQITVGAGNPTAPLVTKSFTQYFDGGNYPFPQNNMTLDITEFKTKLPSLVNQTFYLQVRDTGTSTFGTVTNFSIGTEYSADTPKATVNGYSIYLTLLYNATSPELAVSPTSGPPGAVTTVQGANFTPNGSVNISYLNPGTARWVNVVNKTVTNAQGQFSLNLTAPDLAQCLPIGDGAEVFDVIIFRAVDNGNGALCNSTEPFSEWRRGLTIVGPSVASTGLYGNGTSLTRKVAVVTNQTLGIAGKWFSPGSISIFWDGAVFLGTTSVDDAGRFNASFPVPATSAGKHDVVLRNSNFDFHVFVARLPITSNSYDGAWHTENFTINLSSDAPNSTTYYIVNGESMRSVSINGQPTITADGGDNTLEYWSVDEFGNSEQHTVVTQIRLDKTKPILILGPNQSATVGSMITFLPTTCSDNVGLSSVAWDFGDGATANGSSAAHAYSTAGTYIATLEAIDLAGNVATSNMTVTVQNNVGDSVPEFPSTILLPFMITCVLMALVLKGRRAKPLMK